MSQLEQELLYLERQYWQLPDPDALTKRLVALEQGLAASWMFAGFRTTPPPVGHATGLCGGINLPDSIPISDPFMGVSDTLDWDGSSSTWKKCVSGITWPGNATVMALHYEFSVSGTTGSLTASWAGNAFFIPVASTCATVTNNNGIPLPPSTQTCPPPTYRKLFVVSPASALSIRTLYQSSTTTRTVTVGPVAPV